jgi:hypothetical protein
MVAPGGQGKGKFFVANPRDAGKVQSRDVGSGLPRVREYSTALLIILQYSKAFPTSGPMIALSKCNHCMRKCFVNAARLHLSKSEGANQRSRQGMRTSNLGEKQLHNEEAKSAAIFELRK